jgi:hypothetical protein
LAKDHHSRTRVKDEQDSKSTPPLRRSRPLANVATDLPDLYSLHQRHFGFYEPVCEMAADAASISLSQHHRGMSCVADVTTAGRDELRRTLRWRRPSRRAKASLANRDDATELGACAVAIATVELELGLFVLQRMDVRTGADYYVGSPGQDLEEAHRLEVSGTHAGDSEVKSRLARKTQQLLKGTSDLPAYACIVSFKTKQIALSDPIRRAPKKARDRR